MRKILIFIYFSIFLYSSIALSYPQFIGKGYHACLTCHYNPFGNGPLNDYGRGVAASAIAGRAFIPKSITDEKLGEHSGFLVHNPSNFPISPSYDYRSLLIKSKIDSKEKVDDRFIIMQSDFSLSTQFGERKQYTATATYGYLPKNRNQLQDEKDTFSKEHYIGYRPIDSLGIYIGKMEKVFGLRVPDHTSYARTMSNNGIFDTSSHGATLHLTSEKYDFGLQYFVGDLEKEKEERSNGFSTKFEYSIMEKMRAGLSYLSEDSETFTDTAYSFLTKAGIGKGSSIMFEYGLKNRTTPTSSSPVTSQFIFIQNHIYITRGVYFMASYEQGKQDTSTADTIHIISPGIQWFPMQRLELRGEVSNFKTYSSKDFAEDSWRFLGQVHIWL